MSSNLDDPLFVNLNYNIKLHYYVKHFFQFSISLRLVFLMENISFENYVQKTKFESEFAKSMFVPLKTRNS